MKRFLFPLRIYRRGFSDWAEWKRFVSSQRGALRPAGLVKPKRFCLRAAARDFKPRKRFLAKERGGSASHWEGAETEALRLVPALRGEALLFFPFERGQHVPIPMVFYQIAHGHGQQLHRHKEIEQRSFRLLGEKDEENRAAAGGDGQGDQQAQGIFLDRPGQEKKTKTRTAAGRGNAWPYSPRKSQRFFTAST